MTIAFCSCAPFPKYYSNKQPLTQTTISRVNGHYKVNALIDTDSLENYSDSIRNNAFAKFFRGNGRGSRETMEVDNFNTYSFSVKVLSSKIIEIQYFKDGVSFRRFILEYELKNDGFVYLKNKNFKFSGIPYILGGIDIKRLRFTVFDKSLIIDEVYHSSGGLLLIFGDSKTWTCRYRYAVGNKLNDL